MPLDPAVLRALNAMRSREGRSELSAEEEADFAAVAAQAPCPDATVYQGSEAEALVEIARMQSREPADG